MAPKNAPAPEQKTSAQPSAAEELHEQHTEQAEATGHLTIDEALKLYNDAKKYTTGLRTNWDQYFKVHRGQRVIRNYDGVSDPVSREAHTIIETLVANIAGSGNPKFHFVATTEEQSKDTEVLNGMLDYYMACNQMGLKNQEWVRDMLLYGTGILHVSWRDGKPLIENIPLRDFLVDPTSTGMVQTINPAQYAGHEYLTTKTALKNEMVFDPETATMVPRYKNLDEVGFDKDYKAGASGANEGTTMDKIFKDGFAGSTLGEAATKEQIHVIRLYHLPTGRVYEIGNGKDFIYDEETWCQREEISEEVEVEVDGAMVPVTRTLDAIKPFLPYAVLRDYVDTSQFYGEGEMALLMNDAEQLNDYEAMDIDNNAYQNTPMYWIDPQFADLAPEIETIAGAVYPVPRNAMGAIERPQLGGDLDQKKQRIEERMRRATAADEAVQGVSQTRSRTTATEVQSQLQQAQTRFSTKISNLESEGYAQLGSIIHKFIQIFVTQRTAVRIVGKMGVEFKDYDPWEFNGEYEAQVELDATINQKKQEVGMKMNQVFQLFVGDTNFNQVELKRWMAQFIDPDLTDEKFNGMLAPPAPQQDDAKDIVTINYKDMTPFTKYQAEIKAGFQPDPSHLGDAQTRMMVQANEQTDALNPTTDATGAVIPGMETLLNPPTPPEGMPATKTAPAPA